MRAPGSLHVCALRAFNGVLNRIQQILVAEGLGQKLYRPGFHRTDTH
jgi:hypothetical protein